MFCSNCGVQIDESTKFCPNCGAAQANGQQTTVTMTNINLNQVDKTLPDGMVQDNSGVIRWQFQEGNTIRLFWMDGSRLGYKAIQKKQAETVGFAFKELVKSGAALVADNIVMNSDSYTGQDMPWDTSDEEANSISVGFAYIKKIKSNPKKGEIKVSENITSITLNVTPQQYDFIFNYIVAHCPNAKIR